MSDNQAYMIERMEKEISRLTAEVDYWKQACREFRKSEQRKMDRITELEEALRRARSEAVTLGRTGSGIAIRQICDEALKGVKDE